MEVSPIYENRMLDPPFPDTRYFEVEIDEVKNGSGRTFIFQNIWPVRAKRKPDWHILKFRIRRGSWTITERIHSTTDVGEIQWLYTDDFNLLFVSSGGRHDGAMLISLITGKLGAIALSMQTGARIPSEFENQQSCRSAFGTIFSDGIDGAFRDAGIYRKHACAVSMHLDAGSPQDATTALCNIHGRVAVSKQQSADLGVDIDKIDDLHDLSWLND